MRPSGIRPDLNYGDEEVKQQLAKCLPRVYSELIRSYIPRPSGVNTSRPPTLRPSLPSDMKPSCEGPFTVKPTREELQARVESLAMNKRGVKHKAQATPESSLTILVRSRGWDHLLRRRLPKSEGRLTKS